MFRLIRRRKNRSVTFSPRSEEGSTQKPAGGVGRETMVTAFGRQIAKQIRRRSLRKVVRLCSTVYYDDANKFIECTIRLGKLKFPEEC
ncbi:MAG: hypothetical protein DRO39_00885 [Thermoprotei archaeon]|nr:MAG: hypothetical protein DRO39_00885 [Thermoprotei archaeon]